MTTLRELWPLLDLRVSTPRVELRTPTDADIAALADLAEAGIYEPGETRWMTEWSDLPDRERARSVVQFQWRCRATVSAEEWWLPFVVVVDGLVVGAQDAHGVAFPALRQAVTGSWLGRAHRSQGIGAEARAAVVHLLFEGLGALRCISQANAANERSLGVSAKVGYRPNGRMVAERAGERVDTVEVVLDRPEWERRRRPDIVVEGLDACLPLLGLG